MIIQDFFLPDLNLETGLEGKDCGLVDCILVPFN